MKNDTLKSLNEGGETTKKWTFNYTGKGEEFNVPYTGYYKMVLNGGGGPGGYGGTTTGIIYLNEKEKLYIYVGGAIKLFNVSLDTCKKCGIPGGATDIRLIGGNWYDSASLSSRIMVAGGAGGIDYNLSLIHI